MFTVIYSNTTKLLHGANGPLWTRAHRLKMYHRCSWNIWKPVRNLWTWASRRSFSPPSCCHQCARCSSPGEYRSSSKDKPKTKNRFVDQQCLLLVIVQSTSSFKLHFHVLLHFGICLVAPTHGRPTLRLMSLSRCQAKFLIPHHVRMQSNILHIIYAEKTDD